MKTGKGQRVVLYDFGPAYQDLEGEVLAGLSRRPKWIPSKFFYDERGSEIFEKITELPEYYLTRTELAIMREHVYDMADRLGPGCRIVEFGAGAGTKTRMLLEALDDPVAYVPVDISREQLLTTAEDLTRDYPDIVVQPVTADFTTEFDLPPIRSSVLRTVVFFPGSTIGNFSPPEATLFLRRLTHLCRPTGGVLIGLDLKKDRETLERAYNDAAGVTAEFNLNLLRRINRELKADFDLKAFRHEAVYDVEHGRIEMRLISEVKQTVTVADKTFSFEPGERIITEYSHKYSLRQFDKMAEEVGLKMDRTWMDDDEKFAVKYLSCV